LTGVLRGYRRGAPELDPKSARINLMEGTIFQIGLHFPPQIIWQIPAEQVLPVPHINSVQPAQADLGSLVAL
jgi:hypothetical protein